MKWIFWVLAIALVLIGMDYMLGDNHKKQPFSENSQAITLYEDGLQDLFAFRLSASVTKFEKALEVDPSFAEASIALTGAYGLLGKQDEFTAALAQADSLTELISDPRRRMVAQLRINKHPDTTSHSQRDSLFKRLSSEAPENIFVLKAQVDKAQEGNDMDKAEKVLRQILEVDPNYADSYNMLGYLELRRGNYDQAIEHMQKYAFLSPGSANPYDSLGDILRVTGRYDEAEQQYKHALKIQPDFFHSVIKLGRIYLLRGQLKVGMGIINKVRAEVTGTRFVMEIDQRIINTYWDAGLDEELRPAIERYIHQHPKSYACPYYRAVSLAHQGRLDQSHALMDSMLAERRTSEEYRDSPRMRLYTEKTSLTFEALVSDLTDTPAGRVKAWQKVVALVSEKTPFHDQWKERHLLAAALLDAGQPGTSLDILEPMLLVNRNLINPLILAVECNLALERPDIARKFLDQLKWSLSRADKDLPTKKRASELETLVVAGEKVIAFDS
ncbi:MAG: tetratricopeptide repeat protein [Gemmatimonadales bacterium]|nr:tetratricopeptide repeat protein [Gemmatimonadales bacterium]